MKQINDIPEWQKKRRNSAVWRKKVMSEIYFLNACKLDWEVSLFYFKVESIAFRIKILINVTLFLFTSKLNIAIFLKKVFYRTPLVAASELKSNISNANLGKNKKELFLHFDTSHANQTKFFFYTLLVSKKLQKRLTRRSVVLSEYNSHISWSKTGNYVGKMCSQNFNLRVRFIARLNVLARVWERAHVIACLSWKGLCHKPRWYILVRS